MRISDREITEKLQGLRRITPDAGYARDSRRLILASRNMAPDMMPPRVGILTEITRSLSFVFETALVAALFLVVILGGVFGLSKSLFLPPLQGIDEEALLTEANAINKDINLQLNEIAYFGNHKTSTERVVVLKNQEVKSQTEELPLMETVTDEEIDKLLNQVINEY